MDLSITSPDSFMKFQETTDRQRNVIKPHLPKPAKTGRPRADDRTTINAVMLVLITGCTWIDLPVRYGSKSSSDHIEDSNNLQQNGTRKKDSPSHVQLNPYISKTGRICKRKYQLVPRQFLPKKGVE